MTPVDSPPAHIRVKICGLTNEADARAAMALGADALGFNFWPGSKRYIEPDTALAWIAQLPAGPTRVAVAVDPDRATALRWLDTPGIDALQLHGAETPEFCHDLTELGYRVIKAVRLERSTGFIQAEGLAGEIPLLLDACVGDIPGGTGQLGDWNLAADLVQHFAERRIILAGGLTPGNVTAAVERVRPFAVDVASGVETPGQPRRKDLSRLREFFTTLSEAGLRPKSVLPTGFEGLI